MGPALALAGNDHTAIHSPIDLIHFLLFIRPLPSLPESHSWQQQHPRAVASAVSARAALLTTKKMTI